MSYPDQSERDRVGNHSERPDDDPAICPPLSVRFRHVACNVARMIEQMEDGEFDPSDPAQRKLHTNVCRQMGVLIAQADRLRNNIVIRWRKAQLEAHTDMTTEALQKEAVDALPF